MSNLFSADRVTVRLTSASPWESIRILTEGGIPLHSLDVLSEMEVQLETEKSYWKWIEQSLEKRGDRLTLQKSVGPSVFLTKLLARPILIGAFLLMSCLLLLLPQKLLLLEVEGNKVVPSGRILEAAANCGLSIWVNRRDIRSEKIKNLLLSELPELQWAGVNTYGSRAVISVRERSRPPKETENFVSSIVAARDGIIRSAEVSRGTLHCSEGQAVRRGQLLVSGYTDCGFCIRAERAEAEIYAETVHTLNAVTLDTWEEKQEIVERSTCWSLVVGKKRINLWKDSGIWDAGCDRISTEFRLTLPGGGRLPITLQRETIVKHSVQPVLSASGEQLLREAAQSYLKSQMIAGSIVSVKENFGSAPGCIRLSGLYNSIEMIGREHFEEIGDHYGKDG